VRHFYGWRQPSGRQVPAELRDTLGTSDSREAGLLSPAASRGSPCSLQTRRPRCLSIEIVRLSFAHLFNLPFRKSAPQNLAHCFFQHLVSADTNSLDGRTHYYIWNNTYPLRRSLIGIEHANATDPPPGKANEETFPSAPAVVLPTTSAPGAVRKAIVVNSA